MLNAVWDRMVLKFDTELITAEWMASVFRIVVCDCGIDKEWYSVFVEEDRMMADIVSWHQYYVAIVMENEHNISGITFA